MKKMCKKVLLFSGLVASFLGLGLVPEFVSAQVVASEDRAEAAIGHYARARALLVEALKEFEAARGLARPDLLFDSQEWRISLISRTEDLNRVLSPQPRITAAGASYSASHNLIRRDDVIVSGERARSSSTFGEQQVQREIKATEVFAEQPSRQVLKPLGAMPNSAGYESEIPYNGDIDSKQAEGRVPFAGDVLNRQKEKLKLHSAFVKKKEPEVRLEDVQKDSSSEVARELQQVIEEGENTEESFDQRAEAVKMLIKERLAKMKKEKELAKEVEDAPKLDLLSE